MLQSHGLNHGISGLSLKNLKAKFPNNSRLYPIPLGQQPGTLPYPALALPIHSRLFLFRVSGRSLLDPGRCPPLPAPALITAARR